MSTKFFTPSYKKKVLDICKVAMGGTLMFCGINLYMNNQKFQKTFVMPFVHKLDPETAHRWTIKAAKWSLIPKDQTPPLESMKMKVKHLEFNNPIGIAAGFDKNGEAVTALFKMGFGFVEVGSVTPLPQPGNPKPRVFRLNEIKGVINRYGFNSDGHEAVYERLSKLPERGCRPGILGVNLGKNKTSVNPIQDYVSGVKKFGNIADYLVINISSPNTPGLRLMQQKSELQNLIKAVMEARNSLKLDKMPLLFLKIAPDLSNEDMADIANVITSKPYRIDGLIVSNTTVQRFNIQADHIAEVGGLSGRPLKHLANEMLKKMALLTKGEIPLIAVGGIENGQDAFERIQNGASLVQLYSALVFEGPALVPAIRAQLDECLRSHKYTSVEEAVGKKVLF